MLFIFILQELFYVLTFFLLSAALLESFWPRVILSYLNLNIILILWLFVGIVILLIKDKKSGEIYDKRSDCKKT
jgi:hypothetical protein